MRATIEEATLKGFKHTSSKYCSKYKNSNNKKSLNSIWTRGYITGYYEVKIEQRMVSCTNVTWRSIRHGNVFRLFFGCFFQFHFSPPSQKGLCSKNRCKINRRNEWNPGYTVEPPLLDKKTAEKKKRRPFSFTGISSGRQFGRTVWRTVRRLMAILAHHPWQGPLLLTLNTNCSIVHWQEDNSTSCHIVHVSTTRKFIKCFFFLPTYPIPVCPL